MSLIVAASISIGLALNIERNNVYPAESKLKGWVQYEKEFETDWFGKMAGGFLHTSQVNNGFKSGDNEDQDLIYIKKVFSF